MVGKAPTRDETNRSEESFPASSEGTFRGASDIEARAYAQGSGAFAPQNFQGEEGPRLGLDVPKAAVRESPQRQVGRILAYSIVGPHPASFEPSRQWGQGKEASLYREAGDGVERN